MTLQAGWLSRVGIMLACQAGSPMWNPTAGQVSNPLLPALCYLHKGRQACFTQAYTVHNPIGGKAIVSPDITLRFPVCKQVRVQRQENHPGFETYGEGHMKSNKGAISGTTKWATDCPLFLDFM